MNQAQQKKSKELEEVFLWRFLETDCESLFL